MWLRALQLQGRVGRPGTLWPLLFPHALAWGGVGGAAHRREFQAVVSELATGPNQFYPGTGRAPLGWESG